MALRPEQILEELLALPHMQQLALVSEVLARSPDDLSQEQWDASWLEELDRRAASSAPGLSWEQVRQKLHAK
jgi:hypothetical protein